MLSKLPIQIQNPPFFQCLQSAHNASPATKIHIQSNIHHSPEKKPLVIKNTFQHQQRQQTFSQHNFQPKYPPVPSKCQLMTKRCTHRQVSTCTMHHGMYHGMPRAKSLSVIGLFQHNHKQPLKHACILKKSHFFQISSHISFKFLKKSQILFSYNLLIVFLGWTEG